MTIQEIITRKEDQTFDYHINKTIQGSRAQTKKSLANVVVYKRFCFLSLSTQSRGRTGTGVTPLVFETSASTDSAIWARKAVAKVVQFF